MTTKDIMIDEESIESLVEKLDFEKKMEGSMGYLDAFAIDWWNTHTSWWRWSGWELFKRREIVNGIVP